MPSPACPSREELSVYIVGKLLTERSEEIDMHLQLCADCQASLETINAKSDTLLSGLHHRREPGEYLDEPQCQEALARVQAIGCDPSMTAREQLAAAEQMGDFPRQIGPYRLLSQLGQGGMGTVYKALHTKLDRVVALKLLPEDRMRARDAVARFEREMKAVGKLDHPNIVRASDADEENGRHYLVMEYVDGIDLSELTRRVGRLPIADACELIRQAAVGLQHAHEHGLVHRDIKPSNLMLTRVRSAECGMRNEGTKHSAFHTPHSALLKILDLGLALLSDNVDQHELTTSGQTMGTLDYMAPEQCGDSHAVDIRADIYSLGATLYKLLTGEPIYSGPNYQKPLQKFRALAMETAPPIKSRRAEIPDELAALVAKMIARQPKDRYATPAAVAAALEPFCGPADLARLAANQMADAPQQASDVTAATLPNLSTPEVDTDRSPPQPPREFAVPPNRPARRTAALAFAGIAAALAALVIYFETSKGTVQITINDPEIKAVLDGRGATIQGVDKQHEIRVRPGEHGLTITSGGLKFETSKFALQRGETTRLEIKLLDGEVHVLRDKSVLPLAGDASAPQFARVRPSDGDPDRRAAEWVLSVGGSVRILASGVESSIGKSGKLSDGPFHVTQVDLGGIRVVDAALVQLKELAHLKRLNIGHFFGNKNLTDDGVDHLLGLKQLEELNAIGASITDAGLERLTTLTNLQVLHLGKTLVTSDGLRHLQKLPALRIVSLTFRPISDTGLSHLKGLTNLEALFLGEAAVTDDGLQHLQSLKKLDSLTMGGTKISGAGLVHLKGLPQLKTLNLDYSTVTDAGLEHLKDFTGLTTLQLRKTKVTAAGVKQLAAALPNCRIQWDGDGTTPDPDRRAAEWVLSIGGRIRVNGQEEEIIAAEVLPQDAFELTAVDLGKNSQVTDAALANFKGCQNLTHLALNHTSIGDAGLVHFRDCKNLTSLNLGGTRAGDIGLGYFGDCNNLTLLDLRTTHLTDAGLAHFKDCKNLSYLDLARSRVTDAGIAHFKDCTKLTTLSVWGTQVSDAGLGHLKNSRILKTMDLRKTQVSDAGLEQLKGLKSLEAISLHEAKVTAEGIKQFSAALPNCRIEWDGDLIQPRLTLPAPAAALEALRREHIPPAALAFAGAGDPQKAPPSLVAVLGEPEPIHTGRVVSLAFSSDGRWLASGSDDRTIVLRDTATGTVLRVLRGHRAEIACVAFTPDNQTLVSGDLDGTAKLWPLAEEREPTSLQLNIKSMQMAASPDGRFLAAGGLDGSVKLWKWDQWDEPTNLPLIGSGRLLAIAFSRDGERLACSWEEKKHERPIGLYKTSDGTVQQTLPGEKSYSVLSFRHDGKYLAAAGDREARLWDLTTSKSTDLGRPAFRLSFSPVVNRLALFVNFDSLLHVRDVDSRSDVKGTEAIAWSGMIWSMAFSPDGKTLALGDHLGAVNAYDTATWRLKPGHIEHGPRNANLAIAVSPDGTTLLSSGADNTLRRWDLATPDKHLLFHQNNSPFLVYSPEGKTFGTGGPARPLTFWDAATTSQTPAIALKLTTLAYSPDGKLFAGQGTFYDNIVHLWDVQLGKEVHRFSFVGGGTGLAFSADGSLLAAGSQQGKVAVWNVATGEEVASWSDTRTDSLAFHPGGGSLAIGQHDGAIAFWDTTAWQKLRTLRAHAGPVSSLKFTPDGQSLLSSGVDGFVAVRNPEHERARLVVPVGPKGVPVTFDLDRSGQYLFASGPTNAIYVHWLSRESSSLP